jgi:hypothetical protein
MGPSLLEHLWDHGKFKRHSTCLEACHGKLFVFSRQKVLSSPARMLELLLQSAQRGT